MSKKTKSTQTPTRTTPQPTHTPSPLTHAQPSHTPQTTRTQPHPNPHTPNHQHSINTPNPHAQPTKPHAKPSNTHAQSQTPNQTSTHMPNPSLHIKQNNCVLHSYNKSLKIILYANFVHKHCHILDYMKVHMHKNMPKAKTNNMNEPTLHVEINCFQSDFLITERHDI